MTIKEFIAKLEAGDIGDRNHFASQLTTALLGYDRPEGRDESVAWQSTYSAINGALHGSIDAAVKMVPKGYYISVPCWWPDLWPDEPGGVTMLQIVDAHTDDAVSESRSKKPVAHALLIAALKAMAE